MNIYMYIHAIVGGEGHLKIDNNCVLLKEAVCTAEAVCAV